jgi:GTP-binding protein
VLRVPAGTEILEEDQETVIADLTEVGTAGASGQGRQWRASATCISRPPPTRRRAGQSGPAGVERTIWLRLKLIADVGLLGCPMRANRPSSPPRRTRGPKIADYPFTTLHPNLGVVGVDNGAEFVVADIPA